jgi:two-component system, cell cycle response regulator
VDSDLDETVSALPEVDSVEPSQAYLVVVRGNNVGETFPVTGPVMVIGRGVGADLRLNDDGVSRFHCKLRQSGQGLTVEDLGSRNGTFCNGEPVVPGMRALAEGDRLQVGTNLVLRLTYVESTSAQAARLAAPGELRDATTGLYGRRYFMDRLETEVGSALGHKSSLSLVLVHVDQIQELVAGGVDDVDTIVMSVAEQLRGAVREPDVLARIGTDDFALLSLSRSPGDMFMLAERLRKTTPAVGSQRIMISIGVAAVNELVIETAQDLMVAAVTALHRARSQGGNRVVLCTPDLLREPKSRAKV